MTSFQDNLGKPLSCAKTSTHSGFAAAKDDGGGSGENQNLRRVQIICT